MRRPQHDAMRQALEETAAADGDFGRLNGSWVVTRGELGGVRLPREAFDDLTLRLCDGTFELGVDGGTVAVDWGATPWTMDVRVVLGPNRGRFIPAIFECRGATLRICFDLSGRQRPGRFAAPAGTRRFLVTYQRPAEISRLSRPAVPPVR